MSAQPIFVAILAGGPGSRLWPLSRAARPKFLLELVPGRPSTLLDTYRRCSEVTPTDRVFVVTGAEQAAGVLDGVPGLTPEQVVIERSPRDSLAALAIAADHVAHISSDAVLVTVPADNFATDPTAFVAAIQEAITVAGSQTICTIGLRPTAVSTAHGYIEVVDRAVRSFTEKPPPEVAEEYVKSGRYLWNAGIFVARASTFLTAIDRHHPEVLAATRSGAAAWDALDRLSIDHGIAEPEAAAGRMQTVAAEFGWRDVGDVAALVDNGPDDRHVRIESDGAVIRSDSDRLVAVVGLPGVIVVDTGDAVLVTTAERAHLVRNVVDELRLRGHDDLV